MSKIIVSVISAIIAIAPYIGIMHYHNKCNELEQHNTMLSSAYNEALKVNAELVATNKQSDSIIAQYVATIKKLEASTKDTIKQVNEVVKNEPVAKQWTEQEVPSSIINLINK